MKKRGQTKQSQNNNNNIESFENSQYDFDESLLKNNDFFQLDSDERFQDFNFELNNLAAGKSQHSNINLQNSNSFQIEPNIFDQSPKIREKSFDFNLLEESSIFENSHNPVNNGSNQSFSFANESPSQLNNNHNISNHVFHEAHNNSFNGRQNKLQNPNYAPNGIYYNIHSNQNYDGGPGTRVVIVNPTPGPSNFKYSNERRDYQLEKLNLIKVSNERDDIIIEENENVLYSSENNSEIQMQEEKQIQECLDFCDQPFEHYIHPLLTLAQPPNNYNLLMENQIHFLGQEEGEYNFIQQQNSLDKLEKQPMQIIETENEIFWRNKENFNDYIDKNILNNSQGENQLLKNEENSNKSIFQNNQNPIGENEDSHLVVKSDQNQWNMSFSEIYNSSIIKLNDEIPNDYKLTNSLQCNSFSNYSEVKNSYGNNSTMAASGCRNSTQNQIINQSDLNENSSSSFDQENTFISNSFQEKDDHLKVKAECTIEEILLKVQQYKNIMKSNQSVDTVSQLQDKKTKKYGEQKDHLRIEIAKANNWSASTFSNHNTLINHAKSLEIPLQSLHQETVAFLKFIDNRLLNIIRPRILFEILEGQQRKKQMGEVSQQVTLNAIDQLAGELQVEYQSQQVQYSYLPGVENDISISHNPYEDYVQIKIFQNQNNFQQKTIFSSDITINQLNQIYSQQRIKNNFLKEAAKLI